MHLSKHVPFRRATAFAIAAMSLATAVSVADPGDRIPLTQRDSTTFDLGSGPRHVVNWKHAGKRTWKGQSRFWMVAAPGDGGVPTAAMENAAGIVVEQSFRNDGKVVYGIRVKGDPDSAEKALRAFPEFLSLEPMYVEDKVHPDLFHEKTRRMNRKWARSATPENDPTLEKVKIVIQLLGPRDRGLAKAWCLAHRVTEYEFTPDSSLVIHTSLERLEEFASDPSVESIRKYTPPGVLNDEARKLSKVGAVQHGVLDTITYGATGATTVQPGWNAGKQYTGEGVYVGIWDTGIDPLHPDFLEGGNFRSAPGYTTGSGGDHGTHVAGIVGGNGQSSKDHLPLGVRGRPFQWRGVAPKVRFFDGGASFGASQDVNNHSHITGSDGLYATQDLQTDDATADHNPNGGVNANNIVVYAAGNNGQFNNTLGIDGIYGLQAGYFSMLVNGKNAIRVGSTGKLKVEKLGVSMGPTRDGRLGPDIVAPGGGGLMRLLIQIDSITIRNDQGLRTSTGRSPRWVFDNSIENWTITEQARKLRQETINDNGVQIGSLVVEGGNTQIMAQFGGDVVSTPKDTIIMRIRLVTLDTWPAGTTVPCGWFAIDNVTGGYGNPVYTNVPINQWVVIKTAVGSAFSAAAAWNGINLHVRGGVPDIVSARRGGGYVDEAGSSMAAPHVTGIVALLLQKYGTNYLTPVGKNIHNNPFWNSTAKALLVHTATDLIQTAKIPGRYDNPDFLGRIPYPSWSDDTLTDVYDKGPDWATGYGLVNAQKALSFVDTNLFKERTLIQGQVTAFRATVPAGQTKFRSTLAWDDLGSTPPSTSGPFDPLLLNDLDLTAISPTGKVYSPWVIDAVPLSNTSTGKLRDAVMPTADGIDVNCTRDNVLANPAFKGRDSLNNLEVVDVENPEAGEWTILVHGRGLLRNQNPRGTANKNNQDFSLVADYKLNPGATKGMVIADPTGTLAIPALDGSLRLKGCTGTPAGTGGLVISKDGAAAANLDRTNGFRSANVYSSMGEFLDKPSEVVGGLVFTSPTGRNVLMVSKGKNLWISGSSVCNSL